MIRRASTAAIAALCFSAAGASAHRSFAGGYDESREITIEGELVEFVFRNPHASIHVLAPGDNGELRRWGVEWAGAGRLSGQGVTRDSLRPGDHAVITGNPGRDASGHRIRMRWLLRPFDGFGWGLRGETFD